MARPPKSKDAESRGRTPDAKSRDGKSKYFVFTFSGYKTSEYTGATDEGNGNSKKPTPEIIRPRNADEPQSTPSGSNVSQSNGDQTSNSLFNPGKDADPARQRGADPNWRQDPKQQKNAGPDMDVEPARQQGASPSWRKDPAKEKDAGPDLGADPARQQGASPNWRKDPAKEIDVGPDMDVEPARQQSASPSWRKDPAKEKDAGPDMDTEPGRQQSASPNWHKDPAKEKDTGPNMDTDPARQRSQDQDAESIQERNRHATPEPRLAPVKSASKDGPATVHGNPDQPKSLPEVVVKTFVNDFAADIDRLRIEMSVEQLESMKVKFSTPTHDLVVNFRARELPFDTIVVNQLGGQSQKTVGTNATRRAPSQAFEFLAGLTDLFGNNSGKGSADEEVAKYGGNRGAHDQGGGTRKFTWNGTRLIPGVANGGNGRAVLTAELFERKTQYSWLIKLNDSRQAIADKQDTGERLSPAGIRRLLAPLLEQLGPAMRGGVIAGL